MSFFNILLIITFFQLHSQAATIKQLLNEQNLAIVELATGEKIANGDNFIINDGNSQCLLAVLSVDKKMVTVSTENCADKSVLSIGKKTEKSLFDPKLLQQKEKNHLNIEKSVEPDTSPPPAERSEPKKESSDSQSAVRKYNVSDILYFPEQGQLSGRTSYNSNNSSIKVSTLNLTNESSYTAFFQSVAFGIAEGAALQIEAPYLIDSSSTTNGVSSTTVTKKGFKSPYIGLGIRGSGVEADNKFQFYEFRFLYSSKGPDDNYFRTDFIGLSVLQGIVNSDKSRSSIAFTVVKYNATTVVEDQTYYKLSYSYQSLLNNSSFFNTGVDLSTFSTEKYKTSGTSIVYNFIPSVKIGFGKDSENGNLGFSINYEISMTNASYRPGATSYNLSYGANTFSTNLDYRF